MKAQIKAMSFCEGTGGGLNVFECWTRQGGRLSCMKRMTGDRKGEI